MAISENKVELEIAAKNTASAELKKLQTDLKETGEATTPLKQRLQGAEGSFKAMGRQAGMAGIQLQQWIGQVQGGTNGLFAFSQQASDLGFVLGFPLAGAIAGISSSLLMMLMPAFSKSKDAVNEYEEAMKLASEATETFKSGQVVLAEAIRETAKISQIAAKLDIAKAVSAYEAAIRAAISATDELAKRSGYMGADLSGEMENADDATQRLIISLGRVADIQSGKLKTTPKGVKEAYDALSSSVKELGLDYAETEKLAGLFNVATSKDANPEDLLKFSDALGSVALTLKDDTLRKYAENLSNMAVESVKSKAALDVLKGALVDIPTALANSGNLEEQEKEMQDFFQQVLEDRISAEATANKELAKGEKEMQDFFNKLLSDRLAKDNALRQYSLDIQDQMTKEFLEKQKIAQDEYDKMLKSSKEHLKPIEDGIVNLINGSKDAAASFSDMARSIINDLIRIQIQQSITNPLATAMTDAGGLSGIWNTITGQKALGGAVTAGQAYTVGEHGRETFIPNTNGAIVPNDAIGSGVTINQTIQISTGVQQTVRNEIAQLMPQIANASKAAVLDARKRGGSYAAAFGG